MEATHVLLGRPWQYNRRIHHDGYTKEFTFQNKGHTYSLKPLKSKEVRKYQMIMREKWRRKRYTTLPQEKKTKSH